MVKDHWFDSESDDDWVENKFAPLKKAEDASQSTTLRSETTEDAGIDNDRALVLENELIALEDAKKQKSNSSEQSLLIAMEMEFLMDYTFCTICNEKFETPDHAELHYKSQSHQLHVNIWKKARNDYYNNFNISPKRKRDSRIIEEEENQDNSTCSSSIISTKDAAIEEKLNNIMKRSWKKLVDSNLPACESKVKKLDSWCLTMGRELPMGNASETSSACQISDTKKSGAAAWPCSTSTRHEYENWYMSIKEPNKRICVINEHFETHFDYTVLSKYCPVCYMRFDDEKKLNRHINDVVHRELLRMLACLIKRDIPIQEYWSRLYKKLISQEYCGVCDKSIRKGTKHTKSSSHVRMREKWIERYLPYSMKSLGILDVIDKRLCYCEVCEEVLDGTFQSKDHYSKKKHKKNLRTYCQTCKEQLHTIHGVKEHLNKQESILQRINKDDNYKTFVKPSEMRCVETTTKNGKNNVSNFESSVKLGKQKKKKKKIYSEFLASLQNVENNVPNLRFSAKESTSSLQNLVPTSEFSTRLQNIEYPISNTDTNSELSANIQNIVSNSELSSKLPNLEYNESNSDILAKLQHIKNNIPNSELSANIQNVVSNSELSSKLPNLEYNESNSDILAKLQHIKNNIPNSEVSAELEKFVNTIYFSQKIPLNVGREYLKKYTKIVENLKNKDGIK